MAFLSRQKRRLTEAYAFSGFRPQPTVRGVFGDPKACVIDLVRRSKKRPAAAAAVSTAAGTIGVRAEHEICRAVTGGSSRQGPYLVVSRPP
jgi:hypothetical protein